MDQIVGLTGPASAHGLRRSALAALAAAVHADIVAGRMLGAGWIVARHGLLACRDVAGQVAPERATALDDCYMLMSLSKSFTAMLVLQAVERGQFGLDTPVASLLPAFGAAGKAEICVWHLLTHTAGMSSDLLPPPLRAEQVGDLARCFEVLAELPARFGPGERVCYSPFAGYAVLGQLLVVTDPLGRSFREIARQALFAPLGMRNACFGMPLRAPRRVPAAYTATLSNPAGESVAALLNQVLNEQAELPAGGAFGTLDDVFRFAEAMRRQYAGEPLLLRSQDLFAVACRSQTGERANEAWAAPPLGVSVTPAHYSLLGGQVRGVGSHLSAAGSLASPAAFYAVGRGTTMWMVDPERQLTFVFLSAGILEGLPHIERLSRLSDLALAACD